MGEYRETKTAIGKEGGTEGEGERDREGEGEG